MTTLMISMNINALAERWDCSHKFVRTQIKSGKLPHWKLGGKLLRIRLEDVEEYEQCSLESAAASTAPAIAIAVDEAEQEQLRQSYADARLMRTRNRSAGA